MFNIKYPQIKMSQVSFNKYFSQVDAYVLMQHLHKHLDKHDNSFNDNQLISYLAENIEVPVIKKKIEALDNRKKDKKSKNNTTKIKLRTSTLSYLVIFLVGSGVSYELISILLGISKSYINKLVHNIHSLSQLLLPSIDSWSGKICVDEKYVKLHGEWHFIFSIVDSITGIPLLVKYFKNKTALSWKLFFFEFKRHYGTPQLIVSDGCLALASGRVSVFPNVPFQYCKFHKIKNFIKNLYSKEKDPKKIKMLINKIKQVFSRKLTGNRRKALLELEKMTQGKTKTYFDDHILRQWKHLTKSLTSNAAERWNRKIKRIVSGKYGLKSPETIQQIVYCLWFKELTMNGKLHLSQESTIANLNISKICQEMISNKLLEHLFSIDNQKRSA
jgi:transposase-like protein